MKRLIFCVVMLVCALPAFAGRVFVRNIQENVPDSLAYEWPASVAVKTNALYDLALIPNLGFEYYFGKNISVTTNWLLAWWRNDNKFWYWRVFGGDVAVRYWIGNQADKAPLTGHHIGIYGNMLTYDFELGGRGYLAKEFSFGYGLEYGYSLPLAERLNLDCSLGIGYFGGEFEEYLPIDGHYVWQATKHRHWFGPTKLEVSLSWVIDGEIFKKGGRR